MKRANGKRGRRRSAGMLGSAHRAFHWFAHWTAELVGSPWSFMLAVLLIVGWAVSGPLFGYSDTWQLVINTGTTIVTFLIVFLIQHTQNRDSQAIHLKLDELIRAIDSARNRLFNVEDMTDEEIARLQSEFRRLRKQLPAGPRDRNAS